MHKIRRGVLVGVGMTVVTVLSAFAAGAAPDKSNRPEPESAPRMTRDASMARTRGQSARFKRVDRIEAKRMTWGEFHQAEGSVDVNFKPEQRVWVVATSGDFVPNRVPPGALPPTYHWAVVVYDADTELPLATFAGPTGNWPPYFDRLPDRSQ